MNEIVFNNFLLETLKSAGITLLVTNVKHHDILNMFKVILSKNFYQVIIRDFTVRAMSAWEGL